MAVVITKDGRRVEVHHHQAQKIIKEKRVFPSEADLKIYLNENPPNPWALGGVKTGSPRQPATA